jgi:hypothetical protein
MSTQIEEQALTDKSIPAIALWLAEYMNYNHAEAISHKSGWYRDWTGNHLCSPWQAIIIRQKTIDLCCQSVYPTPADQTDTDCNEPPSLRDYPIILVLWVGMIFMAMGVAIHALYVYLRDKITDNIDIVAVSLLIAGLFVFAAAIGVNCHN